MITEMSSSFNQNELVLRSETSPPQTREWRTLGRTCSGFAFLKGPKGGWIASIELATTSPFKFCGNGMALARVAKGESGGV